MKLAIYREGDNIVKISELHNPKDKGEIGHFLAELESTKLDLIELWENFDNLEEQE